MPQQNTKQPGTKPEMKVGAMLLGAVVAVAGAAFTAWVSSGAHRDWIIDRHRAKHGYGD